MAITVAISAFFGIATRREFSPGNLLSAGSRHKRKAMNFIDSDRTGENVAI